MGENCLTSTSLHRREETVAEDVALSPLYVRLFPCQKLSVLSATFFVCILRLCRNYTISRFRFLSNLRLGFQLFGNIYHHRKVVAIAIKPDATGMGSQRTALVFAFLLEEIVAAEHLALQVFQRRVVAFAGFAEQVGRKQDLVEEVPGTII